MNLAIERYNDQVAHWPSEGRHILAQFDASSIVVYQAYRRGIGRFAAQEGCLGGTEFSFNRMSWIKPNFLWMMYRCGWASKEGQEVVLALRIKRAGFDQILRQAVPSSFVPELYETEEAWQQALESSEVRLQWDPDHDPIGAKLPRRAIQLGLRGDVLKSFASPWMVSIDDITGFVHEQYRALQVNDSSCLMTPKEDIYPVEDARVRMQLGMNQR